MNYRKTLLEKFENKSAIIGIIGLGYVGLPLALEYAHKNFKTIGFDIDERKIPILMEGKSYIKHISGDRIKKSVDSKNFLATSDFSRLTECDAIIICVPTPLDHHREPDLSFIENSGQIVAQYLRAGQIVTLESSTYPGTTEEILLPMFEKAISSQQSAVNEKQEPALRPGFDYTQSKDFEYTQSKDFEYTQSKDFEYTQSKDFEYTQPIAQRDSSLKVGIDFFLAFSPEREDPNNPDYSTSTIPKMVGGVTPACLEIACKLYDQVIVKTIPVSSPRVAEATKLLENIYRSVNIALVNELKMVFDRMDIDVWEVIEAAKTKPFGFHAFYPGPGLGGHCIPIDPFYLTWKAREFDISTKFVELAGEINTYQPYYVVERSADILNNHGYAMKNSIVLILGASYKKNIDDMRESPTLKLFEIFESKGAKVDYSDSYILKLPATRKYSYDKESIELSVENIQKYDLVVLSTDHDNFDYELIAENAKLIVDTRNVFERKGIQKETIYKA